MHQNAQNACDQDQFHYIGDSKTAPQFMVDNHDITDGYRINFNTPAKILKSLFMVHNQSVNIWTHCVSAIIFMFLILSFILMMDMENDLGSLKQYKRQIQQNIQHYHQRLKNLTISEEFERYSKQASQQMSSIKYSLIVGYQEMLNNLDEKSIKMKQIMSENYQSFKTTISTDFLQRLNQFERSKQKFQKQIAPKIVQQFSNTISGSAIQSIINHLDELKQHLDSDDFLVMQLHQQTPNPHHVSKWPIFVFLLSAFICLMNSTIFHLFHPLSSKTYGLLLRFDFAGISLLIAGSAFPSFYYGMYCQMAVAQIYLTWTFAAAIFCFVICLFQWIHKKGNQKYRSVVFGSFGTSMAVPLSHMIINEIVFDNYGDPYEFSSSLVYYILLVLSYSLGLYIFTVRCPQRSNPGKYNLCGHSHQIWHIMVVLGAIFTYFAVMQNFEMRKVSVCPA